MEALIIRQRTFEIRKQAKIIHLPEGSTLPDGDNDNQPTGYNQSIFNEYNTNSLASYNLSTLGS